MDFTKVVSSDLFDKLKHILVVVVFLIDCLLTVTEVGVDSRDFSEWP